MGGVKLSVTLKHRRHEKQQRELVSGLMMQCFSMRTVVIQVSHFSLPSSLPVTFIPSLTVHAAWTPPKSVFLLLINISETTLILSLPFQRQTVSLCNMSCFTCTLLSLQLFLSCMTVTRISIWCHIDNHNVLCSDVVRSHDLDWSINKCFSQRCFVCLLFPILGFPFLSVSSTHLSAGDADWNICYGIEMKVSPQRMNPPDCCWEKIRPVCRYQTPVKTQVFEHVTVTYMKSFNGLYCVSGGKLMYICGLLNNNSNSYKHSICREDSPHGSKHSNRVRKSFTSREFEISCKLLIWSFFSSRHVSKC